MNLRSKQFIDSYIGIPLAYINLFFAKMLGAVLGRNHKLDKDPEHIIFIKLLGFGSVILASDAIWSVKKKYPKSKISIICGKGIFEGVVSLNLFDNVLVIDDSSFFNMISSSFAVLFTTWKMKNKWVVDLEVYSKLTSILSLWTCAINRIGFYFNTVAFRYRLNTHNVFFNTQINVEENYNRIAALMQIDELSHFTIPGYSKEREVAGLNTIAINNTCSELAPERKLEEYQLAALCHWIMEQTEFSVVLLGAPSDFQNNEEFLKANFAGETRIRNIAGIYRFTEYYDFLYTQCLLMITIDSAPLHIANKLNIPNISIWGPTTPESRIHNSGINEVVYLRVSCSPCAHFTDILPCGGNNFCIKNIQLEEITTKIGKIVNTFTRN